MTRDPYVISFLETFQTRASEWALSCSLLLWGIILVADPDTFKESSVYAKMAMIMSQHWWATLCLTIALMRLAMLIVNGLWRRSPHLRATGAVLSCFFWYHISASFLAADHLSTGLAMYPVVFLLDAYNAVRASSESGYSDHCHMRESDDLNP